MSYFRPLALCTILIATAPATAGKPGDARVEEPDKESNDQRIEIFDNNKAEGLCKAKGKVCVRAAPSMQSVGTDAAPAIKRPGTPPKGDWVVDLFGNFKKPALAGNAQFIFSDVEESKAAKAREVTGMYQISIKAGNSVSARVRLSTEDGFRPSHTYRSHIVQLLGGKEVILAEGEFTLK